MRLGGSATAEYSQVLPEQIRETVLLENDLPREYPDEKQSILDIHVLLKNGTQNESTSAC